MENTIEVKNLTKRYAKAKKTDAFAVRDISFNVPKGYIMGFIGPNGAGKTTVIKCILQIKNADAGTVKLFGEAGTLHNQKIGVVLDRPHFPDVWKVWQVEKALAPFYAAWDKSKFSACLKKFDLDPKKAVSELSRGMQVKLQIALALSHHARLLILDEPTSGLDPVARDEICELLQEFVEDGEHSVLFSTHITGDLEKIADYITMILNGKIHFTGTKEKLLESYSRVAGGGSAPSGVLGVRAHGSGFEGLVENKNIPRLPKENLIEPANLEEIIIYLNREAKKGNGENETTN